MKSRVHRSIPPRFVDRQTFAKNFVSALEELSTSKLERFLDETRRQDSGTEAEALMLELTEGHLALRRIGLR